jgi:hypothetical protein
MGWKRLLAYITGSVGQELLLRNEYLVTENRLLRKQIPGRVRLSDGERKTLAGIGKKLGKQALAEVATIVTPDPILAWHRKLIAQKFDGSKHRKALGRPKVEKELEALVVHMAQDNRSWGYDRIAGALHHLGYTISDQTIGNILKRHGISPAPQRKKTTTWQEFIRTHMDMLVATDFFTAEVREILPCLSRNHRHGRDHAGVTTAAVAAFECLHGALGTVNQRRSVVTAHPVWRACPVVWSR